MDPFVPPTRRPSPRATPAATRPALALLMSLSLCGLMPIDAQAQDGGDRDSEYAYGYQTATMDMAAAIIVGTGLALDEPLVTGTGAFAFVAGSTMVHVAQRNLDGALHSASLRVGLPVLLGLLGVGVVEVQESSSDADRDFLESAAPGAVVGALLASVLDAQIFAERERRPGDVQLRLLPLATREGLGASLHGRF